jgi:hypothetical protein
MNKNRHFADLALNFLALGCERVEVNLHHSWPRYSKEVCGLLHGLLTVPHVKCPRVNLETVLKVMKETIPFPGTEPRSSSQ